MKIALNTLGKYAEDILIALGLVAIITATFLLNTIAGVYTLGGCMLGLGIWFTKHPIKTKG